MMPVAIVLALMAGLCAPISAQTDVDILNFALNLEYLEATFYSYAAYGTPLSAADRGGSPAPTGEMAGYLANLSPKARAIAARIADDEIAHVRFLRKALGAAAVPQPPLDVNSAFAAAANAAFGTTLTTPFSPYESDVLFYHGAFIFEDVGVTAYKGASPLIKSKAILEAAAGILATEAYHSGLVRSLLYQINDQFVFPYATPVSGVVAAISNLRKAASGANDDQGILLFGNLQIAAADNKVIAFSRTPAQVLAIVYLGNATKPGGFFPQGLNGNIK